MDNQNGRVEDRISLQAGIELYGKDEMKIMVTNVR